MCAVSETWWAVRLRISLVRFIVPCRLRRLHIDTENQGEKLEKYKILIDTDPGDDIDDVLALAYVLSQDCFELVGVTTVFKETDKRAGIVKKLCALKGVSVPVFYGYGMPLTGRIPASQGINQYADELDEIEFSPDNRNGEEDAVDFIIAACTRYGKALTVLGIGPLTNLARAINKNPVALSSVKETVIMGGDFSCASSEWNIYCDPVGAQTVFTQAKILVAVGVEITSQTQLTEEQSAVIENATKNEFCRYVGGLVRKWRKEHDGSLPVLHDVLAVSMINGDFCTLTEGAFAIDTVNRPGVLLPGKGRFVRYVSDFNKTAFLQEFMRIWNN